jgi:hypothetical protein
MAKAFIPAVAPLLNHYPKHLVAIWTGIDFMLQASYQCHNDTTVGYLKKSLPPFDKMKWVLIE